MSDISKLKRMLEEQSLECAKEKAVLVERVAQLEAENRQLRRMMEVNAPDFPIDEALEKLKDINVLGVVANDGAE